MSERRGDDRPDSQAIDIGIDDPIPAQGVVLEVETIHHSNAGAGTVRHVQLAGFAGDYALDVVDARNSRDCLDERVALADVVDRYRTTLRCSLVYCVQEPSARHLVRGTRSAL
jgi:hypothetical protein